MIDEIVKYVNDVKGNVKKKLEKLGRFFYCTCDSHREKM